MKAESDTDKGGKHIFSVQNSPNEQSEYANENKKDEELHTHLIHEIRTKEKQDIEQNNEHINWIVANRQEY